MRRFDIKRLLGNRALRKQLMVNLIKVTQNREGINTTTEDAERAYDKVQREKENV